jgi:RHS repeat-associated protein
VKFGFQYGYDLAGNVTSMQLPSGRTIYTAWSSGGRALHVSGVRGETMTNYFASPQTPALYAAHGALREAQWGNGLWERWDYLPERLQPWRVRMGSATEGSSKGEWQFAYCEGSWGLSCASNNGNLVGQQIQPANVTQVYSFDALNRISAASESGGGWLETYGFDVHGNLWWNSRSASLGGPHLMRPDGADWFENGNNHAVRPGELEEGSFDAAGNLTKAGMLRLEYDGENRLAKAVGSGSTTYEYDGLGRRVTKREAGGTLTYYVYDAFGGLAAEYLPTGPSSPAGTHYLSTDHLGSTRLVTNANGDVVSRHDYLPFGEEIPNTVGNRQSVTGYAWNGSLTQRFTGKERDGETGLDYFLARDYSGAQGRFSSPDWSDRPEPIPYADLRDPQTLNLYSYGRNSPLSGRDVDGHFWQELSNFFKWGHWVDNAHLEAALQKQADEARLSLAQMKNFALGGKTPQELSKITNNQQVLTTHRQVLESIAAEGMRLCPPEFLCGVVPMIGGRPVFRGGSSLAARPGVDVKVGTDGLVRPGRGISVNLDPKGLERFGGARQVVSMPDELQLVQRGANPNHYEIAPKQPMTLQRFQDLLNQVKLKE